MRIYKLIFILLLISYWVTASYSIVDSVSLKFEDALTNLKSLSDNTSLLLPLYAVAQFYEINVKWSPEREEMVLWKNDTEVRLIMNSSHAIVESSYGNARLLPLSDPPGILKGFVVMPPQDIISLLSVLMPYTNISWDNSNAVIEVKMKDSNSSRTQYDFPEGTGGRLDLKTIVIDAGHGGHDPGANRSGIREKDIVLDVALRLKRAIESNSKLKVVMTRDSDVFIPLPTRTRIANQNSPSNTLFISIHNNASRNTSPRGLETYVFSSKATDDEADELARRENADMRMDLAYILSNCYHTGNEIYNLEFARKVHSSLLQELGLENRGIKRAPFYVLAWTRMPSILVELGFVSNLGDKQKLLSESFRQRAAEALYEGIKDFYNSFSKSLVKANAN